MRVATLSLLVASLFWAKQASAAEAATGEPRSVPPGSLVMDAPGDMPHLDYADVVFCVQLAPSTLVPSGNYRAQCSVSRKTCLLSPNRLLIDGVESQEPLERVRPCEPLAAGKLPTDGNTEWKLQAAIAEAPPGWYRDERGRVMQVNFDLNRRIFLGGTWAPIYRPDGSGFLAGRARVDFGGVAIVNARDELVQHRFHFLEVSQWLGATPADFRLEASLFRYDTSARRAHSPVWLTTFVGAPHRFDILTIGWAAEAGRFEVLGGRTLVTFAELDLTVDLWTSADLDSYLRVRLGPALEYDVLANGVSLRPAAALEGDFTLDRDGFHHLTASIAGEKLFFAPPVEGRGVSPERLRIKAGYELILFAVNDYPVTAVLDARAIWRDDVPSLQGWEFSGNVGLRFSLWAPARYSSLQIHRREVTSRPRAENPLKKTAPPPSAPAPVSSGADISDGFRDEPSPRVRP